MKKIKVLILFITIALISCERDDICAETTATTPRLLIEFYDNSEPDDLKSASRLTIYGDSPDISIPNDDDFSGAILVEPFELERIYNSNTSSAGLPLIIDSDGVTTTSRFILEKDTNLRLDSDNTTNSNVDIIEISYIPEFVYVSRACGYKSIFNNLSITLEASDGSSWIQNIDIIETTIENENTVHVRILH